MAAVWETCMGQYIFHVKGNLRNLRKCKLQTQFQHYYPYQSPAAEAAALTTFVSCLD